MRRMRLNCLRAMRPDSVAFLALAGIFFFAFSASSLSASVASPAPVGRSRMWPKLDFTMKSRPRYLLIVFALAGDSTMTSERPVQLLCGVVQADAGGVYMYA